jgi:hypothetical protein
MTEQPEISDKKSPSSDSSKEDPLSSSFATGPNDSELKSLAFVESSKELNQNLEQLPTDELLRNKEAQSQVIERVVDKVHHEVSLDTQIATPDNLDLIRANHASMHAEINSEIRQTLGENSEVQQLEARVESWRTRNINKALDEKAKIREQKQEQDKDLKHKQDSEQKRKEAQSKEKLKEPLQIWGLGPQKKTPKTVIDLLIDRVLEILGLKEVEQSNKRAMKNKEPSEKGNKNQEDEPILKKILRFIGLIE